ncbi:MAG: hypothetical protein LBR16_06570, partial [Treponema sp.]|nr:hypothetical protein [Treponema sp.]
TDNSSALIFLFEPAEGKPFYGSGKYTVAAYHEGGLVSVRGSVSFKTGYAKLSVRNMDNQHRLEGAWKAEAHFSAPEASESRDITAEIFLNTNNTLHLYVETWIATDENGKADAETAFEGDLARDALNGYYLRGVQVPGIETKSGYAALREYERYLRDNPPFLLITPGTDGLSFKLSAPMNGFINHLIGDEYVKLPE